MNEKLTNIKYKVIFIKIKILNNMKENEYTTLLVLHKYCIELD